LDKFGVEKKFRLNLPAYAFIVGTLGLSLAIALALGTYWELDLLTRLEFFFLLAFFASLLGLLSKKLRPIAVWVASASLLTFILTFMTDSYLVYKRAEPCLSDWAKCADNDQVVSEYRRDITPGGKTGNDPPPRGDPITLMAPV
jgi:hypothetical protein